MKYFTLLAAVWCLGFAAFGASNSNSITISCMLAVVLAGISNVLHKLENK